MKKISKRFLFISLFIICLLIEILIAVFIHDNFIRPYVGDILVIITIYFSVKIFYTKKTNVMPIYIFLFATFVEGLQYINIVSLLSLQNNKILSIIIGSTFDIKDIICYGIGTIMLFGIEKILDKYYNESKEKKNIQ